MMPALPLVPKQLPVAPLNAEAQKALADLQRQQRITKRLNHHLAQAADQLANVALQLNDRGTNYTLEYGKKRRRAEANGEEVDQQEKTVYEGFRQKVEDLTRTMDNGVRSVVDDQTWVDALPEIMKRIARKAEAVAATSQQETRNIGGEDDEDNEATAYPAAPAPEDAPSTLIKRAAEEVATKWCSKTLTERYSQHNTYVGFYRGVYDARNPGDDGPPIPHHSLWFANEEDINGSYIAPGTQPQTQRTRRHQRGASSNEEDAGNSSDIEIAREKISIKCPITFLPFTDPLSSTKCPHSFDRPGVIDMLQRTHTFLPLTDAQVAEVAQAPNNAARSKKMAEFRIKAIPCPVCSILLAEADLKPDPVLLRKVKRIQAAEAREMEARTSGADSNSDDSDDDDDDDDDIVAPGTQRKHVGHGSSPGTKEGKRKSALELKRERVRSKSRAVSVVPQTQLDEEMEDD
ncbi:hypothetical protein GJ744_009984 [Endocarpon pusillum]|uniref:SP-RING-type domain-containing protein n=1 Tax=Endocarpon pusillum TaxID=364733 RepID=A0A8H7AMT2_9EURO|nr:hypothetical protein GJ744_009984 [Endocarpon pusillum]